MSGLNKLAKIYYQPIFRRFTVSSDFLWKSALNPEIWAENTENSNKISEPGYEQTDANHVCMSHLMCHEYLMSSKGENHAKEETWTFQHTTPAVGPDIKSTGTQMRLQHAVWGCVWVWKYWNIKKIYFVHVLGY